MEPPRRRDLIAILANPPLTDGTRTLRRVELAAELLGFSQVRVANLFALPSHATGAIALLGAEEHGWLAARGTLTSLLGSADGALLAFGVTTPSGAARLHFARQVEWLRFLVAQNGLPAWQVGDGPRHPSRWQRWTHRAHPGVPFAEALHSSLLPASADWGSGPMGLEEQARYRASVGRVDCRSQGAWQ